MRVLPMSMLWLVIVLLQRDAYGQYLHLHSHAGGPPVLAVFQGNADWLVEQKDAASHLHHIKSLRALHLVQHEISEAEMHYVAGLMQLRHLMIGQAPEAVSISDAAFAELADCLWLESVWICKEDLNDDDLKVLRELPNLKEVTIEGGDLCEADMPHGLTENAASILASIKNLESVRIRGDAGFSDRSVDELAKLPKLWSLGLRSSRFTDDALKIIASKMKLRALRIESPRFTDEGVRMLKETTSIEELYIDRGGGP